MNQPATATITTATGATRDLPAHIEADQVVGLDRDGRIVVDWFGALTAPPNPTGNFADEVFVFGLTLCCDASDTGVEDGVVCRGCYGAAEVGHYLFRAADGTFPELDPVTSIC